MVVESRTVISNKKAFNNKRAKELQKVVESLREKKLVFAKADKSNNIVVMETEYYERVVNKAIMNGPYVEIEADPLSMSSMIKDVENALDEVKNVICDNPRIELKKWKVSDPQTPCIYVTLKTHKELDSDGDMKTRPVASNINAPTRPESRPKNVGGG